MILFERKERRERERERERERKRQLFAEFSGMMDMIRRRYNALHPKEVAVRCAKTTLRITTVPLHLWLKAWLAVLQLIGLTLATPQKILHSLVTSVNSLLGR